MSVTCVLCDATEVVLLESLDVDKLNLAYMRKFGEKQALSTNTLDYYKCSVCGLGFFNPLVTGNEAFYNRMQAYDWYYMTNKQEYSIAKKYLPIKGSILEVGAGKAIFADTVGKGRYIGLEFNEKAIEKARLNGIKLLKQTLEEHTELGNLYNAVVSFQVLEHIANPAEFIRSCIKSLRFGGVLIISVPSQDSFVGSAINHVLDLPPHHVTRWSIAVLENIASMFGLSLLAIEYESVATYHYTFASKIIWEQRLRNLVGLKKRLLDYSIISRVISFFASGFAIILPIDLKNIMGHTVVAVYKKT